MVSIFSQQIRNLTTFLKQSEQRSANLMTIGIIDSEQLVLFLAMRTRIFDTHCLNLSSSSTELSSSWRATGSESSIAPLVWSVQKVEAGNEDVEEIEFE